MNNLPLQPLVWKGAAMANITHFEAQGAGIFYRINKIDGNHVVVWHDQSEGSSGSKELKNLEEAKNWAEFTHYPHTMKPYVKPTPTWVDVNEREPNEKGDYLIRDYQGRVAMGKYDKGFYMESGGEKWGCVQFWMPIPEFSTMQNNKGE